MSHTILLCEDDAVLADMLGQTLRSRGYRVEAVREGRQALTRIHREPPSLLILDLMLPDMDGFDVCRRLRGSCPIPIIMISGRSGEVDRIVGLELGADNYLAKPFGLQELVGHVDALLRRSGDYAHRTEATPLTQIGRLQLDREHHQVLMDGLPLHLTPKEYELLVVLAENRGTIVRSQQLLLRVWGYDSSIRTRTLDVHIGRLRAKIETNSRAPQYIMTVPGVGYKLRAPEEVSQAA